MVEITSIIHFNKPVDNETVVEITTVNNKKEKYYKACDGIWISPYPVYINEEPKEGPSTIPPFFDKYCATDEQKDLFLKQTLIVLNRVNSSDKGRQLLELLSKGAPLASISEVWNIGNMVCPRTADDVVNRKLRASCIIRPNSGYIENYANVNGVFKEYEINVTKGFVYFHPDCIYSLKKNNSVHYFDPAVALYHELLHVCHSLYNIPGSSALEEEYVTFGHLDAAYFIANKSTIYKRKVSILRSNLREIQSKILNIKDPIDRKYFQEKYGFVGETVIDEKFIDNYISKYQILQSEYSFAKSLKLNPNNIRTSYEEEFFLAFNFDVSDSKIYTIKDGFQNLSNTIEEIKKNPSHIFGTFDMSQITETLGKCDIGKQKRDISPDFIPLEPLRNTIEVRPKYEANRTKRDASQCKQAIAELLKKINTVCNQSKEIPERILRLYTNEQIEYIPQGQLFNNLPPTTTDLEINYKKLHTFKSGELVGFDRITPTDIFNAHRFNHDLVDSSETPLHFTSDNIQKATRFSNMTYTPNEKITKKMNLMDKGKAVLKTGHSIVNIAQFGMWVDEIVEDFKGDTGKDNLHIANDVLSIVPYLGQVMNIGVDIKDENYLGAIKTLGILVLLEVFPELLLPVFLIDVVWSSIQRDKQKKEIVSQAVWNILMEREQLLDSQLETQAENLAHICIERIQKIADHIQRQLIFTTNSIIHNIHYYGGKQFKKSEEILSIKNISSLTRQKLLLIVEEQRNKVIETLFTQLKKTISEDFKTLAQSHVNQFNDNTKTIIKEVLQHHSKSISSTVLDEMLEIVEHHIKKQNIIKTIQHELSSLSNMLDVGTEIILHQTGTPLVYSHIGLNKDNKAVDKLTNKLIASQNIRYYWGRNGNALEIGAGNYLNIEAQLFSHLSLFNDFTIEFWLKVPLTKNYNADTSNDIPIIKSSFDNTNRWAFVLNGIYLQYVAYCKWGKKLTIGSYIIANNKWVKVTVVNNSETQLIEFFINGKNLNSISTAWVLWRDLNFQFSNIISIMLPEHSPLRFMIDDFKVHTLALTNYQIHLAYEQDINPELLYDYFGNCLKENREYVLAIYNIKNNSYVPITQHGTTNFMSYNNQNKIKLKNYDFTISISRQNKATNTQQYNPLGACIFKNDNVILTSYDQHNIWGVLKDNEQLATEENKEECLLSINNKKKPFSGRKLQKLDSDFATKYDSFCTFKIFNILDYFNKSDLFNNNNGVSLALYKENILKSLTLANKGVILTVDNILENINAADSNIKLPPAYNNIMNDLEDYTYKSIFYLFPVDEIEYYSNLYEE